jgi:hypothetical protein
MGAIRVLWRALLRCMSDERFNCLEIGEKIGPLKIHQSARVQRSAARQRGWIRMGEDALIVGTKL